MKTILSYENLSYWTLCLLLLQNLHDNMCLKAKINSVVHSACAKLAHLATFCGEIFAMHLLQRAKNVPYPVQHIPFYRKRLVIAIILHNKIFSSLVYTLCLRGLQYLAGSTHRKVSLSGVVYFFLAKGQITQLVSKLISTTTFYIYQ